MRNTETKNTKWKKMSENGGHTIKDTHKTETSRETVRKMADRQQQERDRHAERDRWQ